MNFIKTFQILDNTFYCNGYINFLEEFPLLFFNCNITVKDKKKFLENFSVKSANKGELFTLYSKGNLNILNKKINFKNISVDNDYQASQEDLNYFKEVFEDILLDESFFEIFDYKKIKNLLQKFLSYFGLVIFKGFIILSYFFSFINPALITSCFKVVPFL